MSEPLISFIIPAHNSQLYLEKCIKSIIRPRLAFNSYEIVIINDASNDNTLKICKRFKRNKNKIRIINNKKKLGVSLSRNKGILSSRGKYLFFLDSDDTLDSSALDKIIKLIKLKKTDVFFNTSNKKFLKKSSKKETKSNKFNFNLLNKYSSFTAHCWNFIIRREFLIEKKIFFKNIKIFEDQLFVILILLYANDIKIFSKKIYNHNERLHSLGRETNSITFISILKIIIEISNLIKLRRLNHEQEIFLLKRFSYMLSMLKVYSTISRQTNSLEFKKLIKKINENLFFSTLKLSTKSIHQCKSKINNDIKKFKNLHNKKIHIFGVGRYGRVTAKLFNESRINFNYFIDNNKSFEGKFYLNKPIISFREFFNIHIKDLDFCLVVLPLDNKKAIVDITKILLKYGLKRKNIKIINWNKIIK